MAVRQSVVLASRNVAVEKFMYELDGCCPGSPNPSLPGVC